MIKHIFIAFVNLDYKGINLTIPPTLLYIVTIGRHIFYNCYHYVILISRYLTCHSLTADHIRGF
jgi:hypothetical protein